MEARLEEQYLREYDPSQFDRPSVTVDILVFTIYQKKLCVLLIKRDVPPYIGKWAIPGGFIKMNESADQAAARKLKEETGIEAFDHATMIRYAVRRMRGKLDYTELGFDFLEDSSSFTLPELREVYEAVLDRSLDAGNFRRTILMKYVSGGRVRQVGVQKESVGRPAAVYSRTT